MGGSSPAAVVAAIPFLLLAACASESPPPLPEPREPFDVVEAPAPPDRTEELLNHPDETVRIAVLQDIGKQIGPSVVGRLKAIYNAAEKEKRRKIQAAALTGIADADPGANHDFLMKVAKTYVDVHGDVATAALRGAAQWVTHDTVDDLVRLLLRVDYVRPEDSREKRAARSAAKPVLVDLLRGITGQDLPADSKIWMQWWDRNKRTRKPPEQGREMPADLNASDTCVDLAHGFELRRPNRRWTFRKPDGGLPHLVLEALHEGQRAAWVEVHVLESKNLKSKSPESMAEEYRAMLEPKFREFRTAEWNRKGVLGGEEAVEQVLFGPHKDFDVVAMRNVFTTKDGVHYFLITCFKSGAPWSLLEDIDAIVKSFGWKK